MKKLLSPFKMLGIEAVYEAGYFGYCKGKFQGFFKVPDRLNKFVGGRENDRSSPGIYSKR